MAGVSGRFLQQVHENPTEIHRCLAADLTTGFVETHRCGHHRVDGAPRGFIDGDRRRQGIGGLDGVNGNGGVGAGEAPDDPTASAWAMCLSTTEVVPLLTRRRRASSSLIPVTLPTREFRWYCSSCWRVSLSPANRGGF